MLPGSPEALTSAEEALEFAEKIGYPVILKAAAGGGGRGMRVVNSAAELPNLLMQAQTEAGAAFSVPDIYLEKYIGAQTQWHQPEEAFYFQAHYVDELRALTLAGLHTPEDYFAIITKGDEVLDWREMQARYAAAKVLLLEGGDHAIGDFPVHLPRVMAHLNCV